MDENKSVTSALSVMEKKLKFVLISCYCGDVNVTQVFTKSCNPVLSKLYLLLRHHFLRETKIIRKQLPFVVTLG